MNTALDDLRITPGRYWYLATPYSKYPAGIEIAFQDACRVAGSLIREKVPVYSPIAHTHPIAINSGIDPYAYDIWLPADFPLMAAAYGLIVATMEGWQESYGITQELKTFEAWGRPIHYLDPAILGEYDQ